jgi:hypothetical protein
MRAGGTRRQPRGGEEGQAEEEGTRSAGATHQEPRRDKMRRSHTPGADKRRWQTRPREERREEREERRRLARGGAFGQCIRQGGWGGVGKGSG